MKIRLHVMVEHHIRAVYRADEWNRALMEWFKSIMEGFNAYIRQVESR